MKADAVFEGGGVKGIAFVGAIEAMEAKGYTWERIAGTSAGAIVAALLACGYNGTEIKELMQQLNFKKLFGRTWMNRFPLLNNAIPLIFKAGIYTNDVLEKIITTWLERRNVRTFGDLPEGKLSIIASNISNGKMVVFPNDLHHYGLSASSFPISLAVRMSTTLPFFFQPYLWRTPLYQKPFYVVDGGMLSNYPIWLFDVDGIPRWPTFGFRLAEQRTYTTVQDIRGPVSLFKGMFKTMLQAHDQRHVDEHAENRTIFIPTGSVTTTKFDLTEEDQLFLMQSGQESAQNFLEQWDFDLYKGTYRLNNRFDVNERYQESDEPFLYH